jgi:hypothetical protein
MAAGVWDSTKTQFSQQKPRLGKLRGAVRSASRPQKVMTPADPSGMLAGCVTQQQAARRTTMKSRMFEITFVGEAGPVVRAEFDDCDVSVGPGTTTLHAGLLDQCALHGLLQRISGLGLELIDVRVAAPRPE